MMDENLAWFLKADLTKYQGKYVAIAKRRVVTSGRDPGRVYEQAKVKFPKDEVVLWKVPLGEVFVFRLHRRAP